MFLRGFFFLKRYVSYCFYFSFIIFTNWLFMCYFITFYLNNNNYYYWQKSILSPWYLWSVSFAFIYLFYFYCNNLVLYVLNRGEKADFLISRKHKTTLKHFINLISFDLRNVGKLYDIYIFYILIILLHFNKIKWWKMCAKRIMQKVIKRILWPSN